jgi:2-polyprenyl-3-methyl-5-hydroxy-6-metoxy-1,4-benzoquinol methylase
MPAVNGETTCYICENSPVRLYKSAGDYDVYKCDKCKLKWVKGEDYSKEIRALYNEDYFSGDSKMGYKDYLADEDNHRRNAHNIIKAVSAVKNIDKLRVLDVGCAFGFLLDECRKLKECNAYGVEISQHAYGHAKKLGLNVINAGFDLSHFESDFFDIVFLIGTIEHLISPREVLEGINRILKPEEGLLVITTIDASGVLPLYSIKPPEHLFYFNHNNLMTLLGKLGFKGISRKTHFVNYYLYDLFHRLKEFSGLSPFGYLAEFSKKYFPTTRLIIPTNEMIVIAKKT